MRRAALHVGMFPPPTVALPQHRFGSAPLALPRVKSEKRKHVLLNNAPPLQAVHPVATARGAVNRISRSAHLNYILWRRSPCTFLSHSALPKYLSDFLSPQRQALSSASCAFGFFPTQSQGRSESQNPDRHHPISKCPLASRKMGTILGMNQKSR